MPRQERPRINIPRKKKENKKRMEGEKKKKRKKRIETRTHSVKIERKGKASCV